MAGAVALVFLAGAALRFATLDGQSLWFDEAVTAHLLRMDLGSMLRAIPDSESTPPLYYVLAWLWTHVFGTGEVGMRSLSALLGTATIGVVWALAKRLGGARAALAAAALVACNPMLVWFSQEARGYALLALLGALSALLWLQALEQPRGARGLLVWGVVAALALATHYYAIFLVGPQALWLLLRLPGWRERALALAVPAAVGAALAPLALGQRSNDSAAFIGQSGLATRIAQVVKQFLVGYDAPAERLLAVLGAVVLLAGLAGLARLLATGGPPAGAAGAVAGAGADRVRAEVRALTVLTVAALAVPMLAALAGEDHLLTRNVLAALPPAAALAGAGLVAAGLRVATVATVASCAIGLIAIVGVARDKTMQREDWRGAAAALGSSAQPRIVVAPGSALLPLRYYRPQLRAVPAAGPPPTAEIDYVALRERRPREPPALSRADEIPPPPAGFAIADEIRGTTFTVVRARARAPQAVALALLTAGLGDRPAAVLTLP